MVVTGGASGIGLATARAFAAAGASVVIADIDADAADAAATGLHGAATGMRVDMTDAVDVERLVDAVVARFGRIDCFHNNAGASGRAAPLHELADAEWSAVIDLNLRGAWLGLKYVLTAMRRAGHGAVVNTASVAGTFGVRGLAAYCASKAGLIALTRVAAIENADLAIRVNAICPGLIDTPFVTGVQPGDGPYPSHRLGAPDEVAGAVLWLCSDAASYVNGTCITIDGGWTAAAGPRRRASSPATHKETP